MRMILLATGSPPLAFTVALFVLGGIPENIAPYLTVALVVLPLSVFLPISAFAFFRNTVRTGRQRLERQIPTSCVICGEPLPTADLRQVRNVQGPHYETAHPDFWKWVRKSRKRTILAVLSAVLIIWVIAVYQLATNNYLLFIVGAVSSAAVALAWNLFEKRKLNSFKNQWQVSRYATSY